MGEQALLHLVKSRIAPLTSVRITRIELTSIWITVITFSLTGIRSIRRIYGILGR
jgi:hypothetical protein